MLTLNNKYPLDRLMLTVPEYGVWTATVSTTQDVSLPVGSNVTVLCEDLKLVGTVAAGSNWVNNGRYRIVGGAGNWGRVVPPVAHQSTAGVTVSMVVESLRQAANRSGSNMEVVVVKNDKYLGAFWTRPQTTAGSALSMVSGSRWWVGYDGVTVVGTRDPTVVTTPYVVEDYDPIRGDVTISVPLNMTVAQFQPGATLRVGGEDRTIRDLTVSNTSGGLRMYAKL